ncbi:hypothetical protein EDC31_10858 [Acidomonas methanolica]|nr:hypothetical protein EDC31_10858 [Acidomonas methanolica]
MEIHARISKVFTICCYVFVLFSARLRGRDRINTVLTRTKGEIARRSVSRVLSVIADGAAIPLGRALRRASRDQPERRGGRALRRHPETPPAVPIRSCSRWGLPCPPCCQAGGALLPHRFTLTRDGEVRRAVCFLWHFPWGRPRRSLTGIVLPWSPDFPPSRRFASTRQRPPDRLAGGNWPKRRAGSRRGSACGAKGSPPS